MIPAACAGRFVMVDVVGLGVEVLRVGVADPLGAASAVVEVEDAAVALVVGVAVAVAVGAAVVLTGTVVVGGVEEAVLVAVGEAAFVRCRRRAGRRCCAVVSDREVLLAGWMSCHRTT